ncbi:PREDICTED: uncharacterized protein K02A2.6-like [Prunus mume]|uniref:Uncharacterized protein K02A2.6-like n=1 Tax=Prunus mume TaxID=102107 RepID=A0ABM0PV98_PRUMU|nr:PREDICTED: uncharacterized protein K02A2.6-like [Prunus mume]
MPFGLKNAGATYQRLVNKIFKEQIGKTMEVYVEDMPVKALERADHIENLVEAFSLLRKYNMKLNPSKCTFGVSSGRFLGYLVTQRGIKAHPNQIKVGRQLSTALASLGSALDTQFRRSIPVEHLDRPSIEEIEPIDSMQIDEDPSWQDPIIDYLVNGNLPMDKSETRKVQQKTARYYMHGSKLIRRSYSGPHLTCIKYPQTLEVLCKIHDGECVNDLGGRSLAQKTLNIGYFWPTMRHDSAKYVIDLVGPMSSAPTKKDMMIVTTDYFTKWIEAEVLSSTKEVVWKNIICRFGCPQKLVTDNGSQFIGKQITAFFAKYKIKQHLSTPRYPQGNGQAEASNKVILDCLKKRLECAEGKWVDELPGVLWAYRTTKRRSTGETPFSLAYGTEAIIPPHVIVPSIGIEVGSIEKNSEQMRLNLDLLEGEREKAIIRVASYQQQLKSYYDKRAKIRQFQPGDLVLRKAFITAQRQGSKKMKPNWEGPYVISRSGGRGSYTLDTMDGKEITTAIECLPSPKVLSVMLPTDC